MIKRFGVLLFFMGLCFVFINCPAPVNTKQSDILILIPTQRDPIIDRLLKTLPTYLKKLTTLDASVTTMYTTSSKNVETIANDSKAGLVLVLDAHTIAADLFNDTQKQKWGEEGFHISSKDVGSWENKLGSKGATLVFMAGTTKLSKQYAVYEFLRRLGARFYHPEHEYIPENELSQVRERAKTPTLVAHKDSKGKAKVDYIADFPRVRSYSFHGAHPLEHRESFSDGNHPIKEAVNVNDWIIKNRGNRAAGYRKGVGSQEAADKRIKELAALRTELGFPTGAGITLHNQQQGGGGSIDRNSSTPVKEQIENFVTKQLTNSPHAKWFHIHFGPTEFTTTPDKETIDWINWAGQKALSIKPNIRILVNNHTSGSQPVENLGDQGCPSGTNSKGKIDYYDLSYHTDKRFGIKVHTVMFYPLEGPANVYHQKSFAHKLCLMKKASKDGRPLLYFPEGSWWLSFDNPIPVYLPLYMWTRRRDIELIKPLLKSRGTGTLDGHHMFNSGHEWGYWQQDYGVGLWHWNVDITLKQTVEEMFEHLCSPKDWKKGCQARDEATKVFIELMERQSKDFLTKKDWKGLSGGLYTYFSGEDPGDEIGAITGFVFSPVRVSFTTVAKWTSKQLEHFRKTQHLVQISETKKT